MHLPECLTRLQVIEKMLKKINLYDLSLFIFYFLLSLLMIYIFSWLGIVKGIELIANGDLITNKILGLFRLLFICPVSLIALIMTSFKSFSYVLILFDKG